MRAARSKGIGEQISSMRNRCSVSQSAHMSTYRRLIYLPISLYSPLKVYNALNEINFKIGSITVVTVTYKDMNIYVHSSL